MGNQLHVTPREDSKVQPPYFNADKIPKRMTKHKTMEVNWKLLEERDDPPGVMQDLHQNVKRQDSKERDSRTPMRASKSGPQLSPMRVNEGSKQSLSRPSNAVGRKTVR